MRKPLLVALALLLVAIALWAFTRERTPGVRTIAVEQGPLHSAVSVTGRVVSEREVNLAATAAGQIKHIAVKEGARVKSGQVLATLDAGETTALVAKAQAELERAQADADLARTALHRAERLFAAGGEAAQARDDARLAAQATAARLRIAQEELALARVQQAKMSVRSPFAGTVTQKFAQIGQWATPGTPLFTVVDDGAREIEAKVDAGDGAAIQVGQEAQVSSDAFPDKSWFERVLRLAPAVQKDETANTFNVRLSLSGTAPPLRFGQQVDVKIRVASRAQALKVPFTALVTNEGKTAVAVVEADKIRFKPVVTGIEDATHTEIVSGVHLGERIVLPEGKKLHAGQRVHVRQE